MKELKTPLLHTPSMAKSIENYTNISTEQTSYSSNLPLLFGKKSKKISIVKPLTHINNDTGKTRHYTPAAQEWFNSVYNYNPNYIKSLPTLYINLMFFLKAFFSSEIK
jgi:hypothetical protein